MARVKRGVITRKRHNQVLKLAKGYRGAKHRLFRQAHEAVMHAGQYAYRDRRQRKRSSTVGSAARKESCSPLAPRR